MTTTWRWGLVGPGGIAERFAADMTLVDDGVITAVASRSQQRADAFGDRFGVPARYGDVEALLENPQVDIVYVATPHARHEADTLAALDAGKHVLCEKPLALSARQARRMAERAQERGLFLMEAMWTRFLPSYVTLVELLANGRIGEPLLVEADFGFRMPVDPAHRLFDRTAGGGAMLDLGIYPVQLCSMVLGAPDRVAADGVLGETGVDELAAAVLHHPGDGIGVVRSSIRAAMSCTARIAGTDGWIGLPALLHCPRHLDVHDATGRQRIDTAHDGDGIRFQVHEVHRCLAAGRTESTVMPLQQSISIASTLDAVRAAIGIVYPGE